MSLLFPYNMLRILYATLGSLKQKQKVQKLFFSADIWDPLAQKFSEPYLTIRPSFPDDMTAGPHPQCSFFPVKLCYWKIISGYLIEIKE